MAENSPPGAGFVSEDVGARWAKRGVPYNTLTLSNSQLLTLLVFFFSMRRVRAERGT